MNKRAQTLSNRYDNKADGTVTDNAIFGVFVSSNGYPVETKSFYYRRRTSFAGVFTGSYEEAQRLAKKHVNG